MENENKLRAVIKVKINEIEYDATVGISVRDLEYISSVNFKDERLDYKKCALVILRNHLRVYPDEMILPELIYDSELKKFIKAYVESSQELKSIYRGIENEDIFAKFILCLRQKTIEIGNQISEHFIPVLQNFWETIQPKLTAITQTLRENVHRILPLYLEISRDLTEHIGKMIESIQSPLISDEWKNELKDSFEQWGKFGWTIPPNADVGLFFEKPVNRDDAYKKIQPYINKEGMETLFDILMKMKYIRKSDLKEAIIDYENKRYKSCVMVLFAIIDSRIIRLQESKKGKRRPHGYRGANLFFENIQDDENIKMTLMDLLSKYSVLAFMKVVFESGDDFKKQPDEINRNFIDHGMFHRKVTQRDCKKMFLLLYNFINLVEVLVD